MAGRDVINKGWLIVFNRPSLGVGYGVYFCHAHPGGYAVLRWEASWRTINGIHINTPRGSVWLLFRRWRCAGWKPGRRA